MMVMVRVRKMILNSPLRYLRSAVSAGRAITRKIKHAARSGVILRMRKKAPADTHSGKRTVKSAREYMHQSSILPMA